MTPSERAAEPISEQLFMAAVEIAYALENSLGHASELANLRDATSAYAAQKRVPVSVAPSPEHVAWLRYICDITGQKPTRIVVCDSDHPDAFKVYRAAPVAPTSHDSLGDLTLAKWWQAEYFGALDKIDALRAMLKRVLDTHEAWAGAVSSAENAQANFSNPQPEIDKQLRAAVAASDAERDARKLLADTQRSEAQAVPDEQNESAETNKETRAPLVPAGPELFDGMVRVPCAVMMNPGHPQNGWLFIPHADDKWVSLVRLDAFSGKIIEYWLASNRGTA